MGELLRAWWPLTLSWLCLSFEAILVTFSLGRMPDSTVQIAAFSGIVYPVICLLESPIYALLSTANTLCEDRESYRRTLRYSLGLCAVSSVLQILFVIPPIFDFCMGSLLKTPVEVQQASYGAFLLLLPSSILVGVRRFYQGLLVRFGLASLVGRGSMLRIGGMVAFLLVCVWTHWLSGAVAGSGACLVGVSFEAVYAYRTARSAMAENLTDGEAGVSLVTLSSFTRFYLPLAMTSLLLCLAQPTIASAMNRAPLPLESLVVWPVAWQLAVLLGAAGSALPDLTVSFLSRGMPQETLDRFVRWLMVGVAMLVAVIALSPLSTLWFGAVMKISPELWGMGWWTLLGVTAVPVLRCRLNQLVGRFLYERETLPITEGMMAYLGGLALLLVVGVPVCHYWSLPGTAAGAFAATLATAAQVGWMAYRHTHRFEWKKLFRR